MIRRLYQAIVIPQMLHNIAAWFDPTTARQHDATVQEFAKIQHQAACLINSTFRSTATEALNIELHLSPIQLQIEQIYEKTAIQIQTRPQFTQPARMSEQRPRAQQQHDR
jgi:hypothetical protein